MSMRIVYVVVLVTAIAAVAIDHLSSPASDGTGTREDAAAARTHE